MVQYGARDLGVSYSKTKFAFMKSKHGGGGYMQKFGWLSKATKWVQSCSFHHFRALGSRRPGRKIPRQITWTRNLKS